MIVGDKNEQRNCTTLDLKPTKICNLTGRFLSFTGRRWGEDEAAGEGDFLTLLRSLQAFISWAYHISIWFCTLDSSCIDNFSTDTYTGTAWGLSLSQVPLGPVCPLRRHVLCWTSGLLSTVNFQENISLYDENSWAHVWGTTLPIQRQPGLQHVKLLHEESYLTCLSWENLAKATACSFVSLKRNSYKIYKPIAIYKTGILRIKKHHLSYLLTQFLSWCLRTASEIYAPKLGFFYASSHNLHHTSTYNCAPWH